MCIKLITASTCLIHKRFDGSRRTTRRVDGQNNISKDLKEGLLKLWKSMLAAQQAHENFIGTVVAAAEPVQLKLPKSTQTEAFAFAGNTTKIISKEKGDKARESAPTGCRRRLGRVNLKRPIHPEM